MIYSMPEPKIQSAGKASGAGTDTGPVRVRARILSFGGSRARVLSRSFGEPTLSANARDTGGARGAGPVRPAEKPARRKDGPRRAEGSVSRPVLDALLASREVLQAAVGTRVSVHVSGESGLPALALDDDSLERVLLQLVKNSSEAMPEGGDVHIVARRALNRSTPAVLVHVSDDGHGIPALALEHIFKPGFSSRRDTRGWNEPCGLGLSIVQDLVQRVGGSIEVASRRRRGTTFELRIPCKLTTDMCLSSGR